MNAKQRLTSVLRHAAALGAVVSAVILGTVSGAAAQAAAAESAVQAAPAEEPAATAVETVRRTPVLSGVRIKNSPAFLSQNDPEAAPQGLSRTLKTVLTFGSLLLAALYVHQRIRGRSPAASAGQAIEIVARQALSPRAALIIVRAEDKKFLLSQNGDEVKLVAELEPVDNFQDRLVSLALAEQEDNNSTAAALAVNS